MSAAAALGGTSFDGPINRASTGRELVAIVGWRERGVAFEFPGEVRLIGEAAHISDLRGGSRRPSQ